MVTLSAIALTPVESLSLSGSEWGGDGGSLSPRVQIVSRLSSRLTDGPDTRAGNGHAFARKATGTPATASTDGLCTGTLQDVASPATGKSIDQASRKAGGTGLSYYRWSKECRGLKGELARRLKEHEREGERLKILAADRLEKSTLPKGWEVCPLRKNEVLTYNRPNMRIPRSAVTPERWE